MDAALAQADAAVPGVPTVLDQERLRRWTGWPHARVDRLRRKPSTSLRAAVDPGDGGPWWLLTAHSEATWRKAGKDVRAAGQDAVVDEDLRLVRVPVLTDRALPHLAEVAAGARTVAHNPARRAVLRSSPDGIEGSGSGSGECRKVHADARTAGHCVRATRTLLAAGVPTPPADLVRPNAVRTPWLPGRAATAADRAAVAELVRRWAGADTRHLPVLGAADLRRAVERAVAGTPALDAEFADRLRCTVSRWRDLAARTDLTPAGFAHGDLSPDQLLHDGRDWVVLDLDRACRAPAGWDLATWDAAVAAASTGPHETAEDVPPVLLAAAALLRAPEPFRRRRPGWAGRTRRVVDVAARAVGA